MIALKSRNALLQGLRAMFVPRKKPCPAMLSPIVLWKITYREGKNPQSGRPQPHAEWSRIIVLAETLQSSSNDNEADRAKRPAIQRRGFDCPHFVPSPGAPTIAQPAPDLFPHQAIDMTGRRLRLFVMRRRLALKKLDAHLRSIRAA